jgi:hypothetical protein
LQRNMVREFRRRSRRHRLNARASSARHV